MADEDKLKGTLKELEDKIEQVQQEQTEMLKQFNLAIVDTKDDMRIVNTYGAIESLFYNIKDIDRGDNIVKIVYRTTRNTKDKEESDLPDDEKADLADSIDKFVQGKREEKIMKVLGEKEDGELFLLEWKMVRKPRFFRSYFNVIPTNAIIRHAQEKHAKELDNVKQSFMYVYELIDEGITIIDNKTKIIFMNEGGKKSFIANEKMRNAPVEGRYFKDIFVNETSDETKHRQDLIRNVIQTASAETNQKRTKDALVTDTYYPIMDNNHKVASINIISKFEYDAGMGEPSQRMGDGQSQASIAPAAAVPDKKLIEALKHLSAENKKLQQRNEESQRALEQLYKLLDKK